jgi:hypothetical protein
MPEEKDLEDLYNQRDKKKPKSRKRKDKEEQKNKTKDSTNTSDPKQLKEVLEIMRFYSTKHLERSEKGLKKAYYPEYVVSQMGLEAEKEVLERNTKAVDQDDEFAEGASWRENKDYAAKQRVKEQLKKKHQKRKRTYSDNLFSENNTNHQGIQAK